MAGESATSLELPVVRGGGLFGDLLRPDDPGGLVVFVHGSGSSRHSPRNRWVADQLCELGMATLLMDLLTEEEDAVDARTQEHRFDISLLTDRVVGVLDWVAGQPWARPLGLGLFGASTGAAAALDAAVRRPEAVAAVVSRGGRPDMATETIDGLRAPVLLLVGAKDDTVLALNERVAEQLGDRCSLRTVAGATHLFAEPGALAEVADAAGDWFRRWLGQL